MPFFSRQKFMITWAKLPHVPGAPPPHRHQNPPHTHAQRANGCFHFFSNRDIFWSIFKIQKLFLFLWAKTIGARNRNTHVFSRQNFTITWAKLSHLPQAQAPRTHTGTTHTLWYVRPAAAPSRRTKIFDRAHFFGRFQKSKSYFRFLKSEQRGSAIATYHFSQAKNGALPGPNYDPPRAAAAQHHPLHRPLLGRKPAPPAAENPTFLFRVQAARRPQNGPRSTFSACFWPFPGQTGRFPEGPIFRAGTPRPDPPHTAPPPTHHTHHRPCVRTVAQEHQSLSHASIYT